MKTILEHWIEFYKPDNIFEYDINKCIFVKDNHIHFVLWELSGVEAIHLVDEEIKKVIDLDYEVLGQMFKEYLEKNYS